MAQHPCCVVPSDFVKNCRLADQRTTMHSATCKPWLVSVLTISFLLQQYNAWIRKEPQRILQNLATENSYPKTAEGESGASYSAFQRNESQSTTNLTFVDNEPDQATVSLHSGPERKSKPAISSNSTFLGCVLPRPDLPVCTSGQDFLSIEKGGFWKHEPSIIKDKSAFDGFAFKQHSQRASCDSTEYRDPYVWSASCSVPAVSFMGEQRPLRIMLSGDSLMMQLHDTSTVSNLHPFIQFSKLYTIPLLNSISFTSKVCEVCGDALRERPSYFDKDLVWLEDNEFLAPYEDFDFIFYNEFAHFSGTMVGGVLRTYKQSLQDGEEPDEGRVSDLMAELYDWFDQQMTRKAEIFKRIKGKVYYLTSPAHAYPYIVALNDDAEALRTPLANPTRVASQQDCFTHEDKFGGAFCYSHVNNIASSAFEAGGHGILPMDLTMGRRVDAHPCRVDLPNGQKSADCLHYCLPGPPNVMLASIVVEVLAQNRLAPQTSA